MSKLIQVILAIAFIVAAIVFIMEGKDMRITSSMHQIYQMMYYICSVLCFGFGAIMIKGK